MKKILGLAIAAVLIMATVGFGTWAYFSDTETSSNNAVAAGTLDLTLSGGSGSPNYSILTGLTNKSPGDSGSNFITLNNIGSLAGELDIAIGAITNTESAGASEFENDSIGGGGVGELGQVTEIAIWLDLDNSGTWNTGDKGLKASDGSVYTNSGATALDYATVNTYGSKNFGGSSGVTSLTASGSIKVYIEWRIPSSANVSGNYNAFQGDSFSFTITFTLEQAAAD